MDFEQPKIESQKFGRAILVLKRLLYPFLLALYFVFFVFSENLGQAFLDETIRSVFAVLITTALLLLIFTRLLKSADRAAFVTALLIFFIVTTPGLEDLIPKRLQQHTTILLIAEIIGLVLLGTFTVRKVGDWSKISQPLTVVASVLLLLAVFNIGKYGAGQNTAIFKTELQRIDYEREKLQRPDGELPSIFYLLVDAYARQDSLQEYFNYDNSEFIGFLKDTGFLVADNSTANYHSTEFAIPTVLNLDYVADQGGLKKDHPDGYKQMILGEIFNNKVAMALRNLGYRIVTLQSQYNLVRIAGAENLRLEESAIALNEFESALLNTTILPRVFSKKFLAQMLPKEELEARTDNLHAILANSIRNTKRDGVDFVLEEISRQASREGPMFVVGHIMVPHQPFIYDRNGDDPALPVFEFGKLENLPADIDAYADQVHYTNIRLRELINNILEASATPPIIILQGDHGLRLTWLIQRKLDALGQALDEHEQVEAACLRETLANLNAMYLPGFTNRGQFYDSISPVNTFRLIFNEYFGADLELLDDRVFFNPSHKAHVLSNFIEVTGRQNSCDALWEQRLFEAASR